MYSFGLTVRAITLNSLTPSIFIKSDVQISDPALRCALLWLLINFGWHSTAVPIYSSLSKSVHKMITGVHNDIVHSRPPFCSKSGCSSHGGLCTRSGPA